MMSPMMRENKRILSLRMLIAFQDTMEFGFFIPSPETQRIPVKAKDVDDCPACGMPIDIGDLIFLGSRKELFGVVDRWIHAACPVHFGVQRIMDVRTAGRAVSEVGRLRRPTRCAECGNLIRQGEESYREFLPVRRTDGSRSQYLCEPCAVEARR